MSLYEIIEILLLLLACYACYRAGHQNGILTLVDVIIDGGLVSQQDFNKFLDRKLEELK